MWVGEMKSIKSCWSIKQWSARGALNACTSNLTLYYKNVSIIIIRVSACVFGCSGVRFFVYICVCVCVNACIAPNLNVCVLSMDHSPSTIVHTSSTSILGSYFAYICYLNLILYIFICWAWTTSRGFMTAQQKLKDVCERYENSSFEFVHMSYAFKQ